MKPYYEDGSCVIYHGDCREILPGLTADVVITDPPYGIDLAYNEHNDDWRPTAEEVWTPLVATGAKSLHFTSSNRHLPFWLDEVRRAGWEYMHCSVYWNDTRAGGNWNGQFAYAWEPILSFKLPGSSFRLADRMMSDVFAHGGRKATAHPAERDRTAWGKFLRLVPGDTILDPFLGSGTTLLVARDFGRKAIGVERDERYCELAARRLNQGVLDLGA